MKKLVIINGVTGAIGSACLSLFASDPNTVVYGISRKAKDFREIAQKGKLPISTLICSISSESYPARMATYFAQAIQVEYFSHIVYIHCIGVYPFEIDKEGNRLVMHDNDCDGIDDRCGLLTNHMFSSFFRGIPFETRKPTHSFIFGGIADKHEPIAHRSWWFTVKNLKDSICNFFKIADPEIAVLNHVSFVNISSVLCPNELISRPFVFSETDNNPQYWLRPEEVASFVATIQSLGQDVSFKEYELFKKKPGFDPEYYTDEKFTPRKIKELFR
jgi:hypothetical protein